MVYDSQGLPHNNHPELVVSELSSNPFIDGISVQKNKKTHSSIHRGYCPLMEPPMKTIENNPHVQ
jgi:hypothetical protein